ncbi:hypothetical protein AB0L88_14385, partial [Saccharopolyspora shandongensis]|uniref:hypothetical protein n=1 Tax=Saccharopolyspora shandongensis TaxID=418495 RepID=UPI00341C3275
SSRSSLRLGKRGVDLDGILLLSPAPRAGPHCGSASAVSISTGFCSCHRLLEPVLIAAGPTTVFPLRANRLSPAP